MSDNRLAARQIELEVLRYDPEKDQEPHFERYSVPCINEWCVLDALNYLKDNLDPTLPTVGPATCRFAAAAA